MQENRLIDTEEAAIILGVHPGTLRTWVAERKYNLQPIKHRGAHQFLLFEVLEAKELREKAK